MRLFLDFETFFDTKAGYTLANKLMSTVEYVRHKRFSPHGAGVALDNAEIEWFGKESIKSVFRNRIDWDNTDVVAHNTKFDGLILMEYYGIQPRSWICTQGMAAGVLGKRVKSNSLRDLAEYYKLDPKGEMKTDGIRDLTVEQEKELAEYCKHDVYLCRELFNRLEKDFPKTQYSFLSWTIQNFVKPQLELDVPLLEHIVKDEKDRKEKVFKDIGILKEVFASNKQFPALLESRNYSYPMKISPSTGKQIPALALGDPDFVKMRLNASAGLKTFCNARVEAKSVLLETRAKRLIKVGNTGKWPYDVVFSGAKQTHRLSGGSGGGGNPQNFPRDSRLRQAVVAPEGFKLVIGDCAQIEMRFVAYLSNDPILVGLIENDTSLYCEFASKYYGRTITKKDTLDYRFGKTAILGLGYSMGWQRFQKQVFLDVGITITDQEAKDAVSLYRKTYKQVPSLWRMLDRFIGSFTCRSGPNPLCWLPTGFDYEALILPSGLKMMYPNLRKGEKGWIYDIWDKKKDGMVQRNLYGGKILENICQGLTGDFCKEIALEFGNDVVGLLHDEVILCVREDEAQAAATKLRCIMMQPPKWFPKIKLDCEIKIGDNWRDAK